MRIRLIFGFLIDFIEIFPAYDAFAADFKRFEARYLKRNIHKDFYSVRNIFSDTSLSSSGYGLN
jgi:hypothetical protein